MTTPTLVKRLRSQKNGASFTRPHDLLNALNFDRQLAADALEAKDALIAQLVGALESSLNFVDAMRFNTSNQKKVRDYSKVAIGIQAALDAARNQP